MKLDEGADSGLKIRVSPDEPSQGRSRLSIGDLHGTAEWQNDDAMRESTRPRNRASDCCPGVSPIVVDQRVHRVPVPEENRRHWFRHKEIVLTSS